MSERTLTRIVLALVVLVGLYVVMRFAEGTTRSDASGNGGALASIFQEAAGTGFESALFASSVDTIALEPSPSGWLVNGYPADSAMVERFWESLTSAQVGDLVATNPANHDRLGVSDEMAAAMELREAGGGSIRVLLGSPGPSWSSVYGRVPGEDDVYLIRGDLRSHATRSLTQWRDKRIAAVDTATVARMDVVREGAAAALVRADSVWTANGEPGHAARIRSILSEIARLDATDFAPDTLVLPESTRTLLVQDAAGDTLLHILMAQGEGENWWARRHDRPTIYQLTSWRAGRLVPEADSLRALPEGS